MVLQALERGTKSGRKFCSLLGRKPRCARVQGHPRIFSAVGETTLPKLRAQSVCDPTKANSAGVSVSSGSVVLNPVKSA